MRQCINALQQYLIDNKAEEMTVEQISNLMAKKRVNVSYEPGLLLFNYSFNPDFSDTVVKCCRGIILYEEDFSIACYPFDKFNNYNSDLADDIDWSSAKVLDKMDGQIMKVWFNKLNNQWTLSSNSCIFAEKCFGDSSGKSAAELFNLAEDKIDYNLLDKNNTYIFELTSKFNTIVIQYNETHIWHIGTRSNTTGLEFESDIKVRKPLSHEINSLEEAITTINNLCDMGDKREGFVVVDKDYHRIKVKSEYYKQLHYSNKQILGGRIGAIKSFREKNIDEIYEEYPELRPAIRFYQWQFEELLDQYRKDIIQFKIIISESKTKKEFAKRVGKHKNKALAFNVYKDTDYSEYDYLNSMRAKDLARLIKTYNKE